jgi:hypothetical protein
MDSDDISTPDRLALQVRAFDENPNLVCLGGFAQCIDPDGEILNLEKYPLNHADILLEQSKGGAMRFPSTMARRAAALGVGGFREPFQMGEDFDFLLRLSEIGQMANISNTIYFYRQHISSVCGLLGGNWLSYRDAILQLAKEREETGKDRLQKGRDIHLVFSNQRPRKTLIANTYLQWASYAAANNNKYLAWRYVWQALKTNPAHANSWKTIVRLILKKSV